MSTGIYPRFTASSATAFHMRAGPWQATDLASSLCNRLREAEGALREALQEKDLLERKLTRQRTSRAVETAALQARNPEPIRDVCF